MERKGIEFPIEQTAEPVFEPRFKEQAEIKKAEEQIVDLNEKITQIQQLKKEEMQRIEQERYDAERAEKYAQHRLEEKIDSQYEYDRIGAMFDPEMEEKWLRLVADGKVSRDKQTIEAAEYAIAERNGKRVDINNPFAIIKKLEYLHYTNIYLRCEKNELNQNIEAFDPKKLKAEMKKKADEHFELKKQYEKEASIFKIGIESVKLVATLGVNWKNTKAKLDRLETAAGKSSTTASGRRGAAAGTSNMPATSTRRTGWGPSRSTWASTGATASTTSSRSNRTSSTSRRTARPTIPPATGTMSTRFRWAT